MAAPKPPSPSQAMESSKTTTSGKEDARKENVKHEGPPPAEMGTDATDETGNESDALRGDADDAMEPCHKPPAVAEASAASQTNRPATTMNYSNTKNSESYHTAKTQLNAGNFEAALETIELAIKMTLSLTDDQLHESLAPLYYLYGTTLLYSVEESDNPEASVMVNPQQQEEEEGASGGAASEATPNAAASAEDLQFAWENLESARSILSRLTTPSDFACASSPPCSKEGQKSSEDDDNLAAESRDRVLDLAQVHVRLGDLQRANGNYAESVQDYGTSLEMRTAALGKYDRKVADVHYNLGATYLMLAAEGEKGQGSGGDTVRQLPVSAASAATAEGSQKMSKEEIRKCREQSLTHYLACGRAFGGLIAKLCGSDPDKVAALEEGQEVAGSSEKVATASGSSSRVSLHASSQSLKAIRDRVASLPAPDNTADSETVADLKELLDEIQETIDESEKDMGALHDVSLMKAKAEKDIEMADRVALKAGLEASTAESGGATTTVGFGAAAAATAAKKTNVNAPMMVVKKKKKKRGTDESGEGDGKPSSQEVSKRAKTE